MRSNIKYNKREERKERQLRGGGEVLQQCHSADARLASGQTDPLVLFLLSLCVCVWWRGVCFMGVCVFSVSRVSWLHMFPAQHAPCNVSRPK